MNRSHDSFGPDARRRRRLLIAACALAGAAHASPGYEWRRWPANKRVPKLELSALDGTPWRIADQRGRVLLANFWATWCEPCRAEMPSLERLARRRAGEGLSVVAINYREGMAAIERFVQALALGLPVLLDRDGAAAAAWTPRIFPSTVVFDRAGRPAGVLVGEIDWESAPALALIEPLLAARSPKARA